MSRACDAGAEADTTLCNDDVDGTESAMQEGERKKKVQPQQVQLLGVMAG